MKPSIDQDPVQLSRKIEHYTRHYAENRTLPHLAVYLWMILSFVAIFGGVKMGEYGYSIGQWWLAGLGGLCFIGGIGSILLSHLNKFWCLRVIWRWGTCFYRRDGYVPQEAPWDPKPKQLQLFLRSLPVMLPVMICLFGHVALVRHGYLPLHFTVPLSALYIVPFLFAAYKIFNRDKGPWYLLVPVFYSIYSLLTLAGFPFTIGQNPVIMICSPMLIFHFVAAVIGHVYSRFALRKVKSLTRLESLEEDQK